MKYDFSKVDPKSITVEDCLEELRFVQQIIGDDQLVTRAIFRRESTLPERVWEYHFGTFGEFRRQAGIQNTRSAQQLKNQIAKHASVDNLRKLNEEKKNWDEKYIRVSRERYKTIMAVSDIHDIEVDPFFLRVFLDTAKRVQPDVICFVGDLFDLPEFGKYNVDPREWDVVGRIKFVHENILEPLRTNCPNAQIDLIEGNHEARLLNLLCEATPAVRAVLSDLHGMTLQTLLGLDKYQINYISKSDLSAWNKGDVKREVANNYKVYYDCVLMHHLPQGETMGMPGCHGHHHRHTAKTKFSPVYGNFEWHQLGCGHKRNASYCEGERWGLGFALVHLDSNTRHVNFEYVPVSDFAVVGGKWYYRNSDEPAY